MNAQEETAVNQIIKETKMFLQNKGWDVGLAIPALSFVIKDLLLLGIEQRPEVKRTLVKYTNSTLNMIMRDVEEAL